MEEIRVDPGEFKPVGEMSEATPARQLFAEDEFSKRMSYAEKSETHIWIVMVTHFATDQMLDGFSGVKNESPILDHETIAMRPVIVCYICEESFEPRLRHRKCNGHPEI